MVLRRNSLFVFYVAVVRSRVRSVGVNALRLKYRAKSRYGVPAFVSWHLAEVYSLCAPAQRSAFSPRHPNVVSAASASSAALTLSTCHHQQKVPNIASQSITGAETSAANIILRSAASANDIIGGAENCNVKYRRQHSGRSRYGK
jgi:hypothetical protein